MERWTPPEAQEAVKKVSMRRKGVKAHPTSLASLEHGPVVAGACMLCPRGMHAHFGGMYLSFAEHANQAGLGFLA